MASSSGDYQPKMMIFLGIYRVSEGQQDSKFALQISCSTS
jgi:hypothetical protein